MAKYDRAIRSEAALLEEYGLEGLRGSVSLNEPVVILPYTSSVEIWMNRSTCSESAASRRV